MVPTKQEQPQSRRGLLVSRRKLPRDTSHTHSPLPASTSEPSDVRDAAAAAPVAAAPAAGARESKAEEPSTSEEAAPSEASQELARQKLRLTLLEVHRPSTTRALFRRLLARLRPRTRALLLVQAEHDRVKRAQSTSLSTVAIVKHISCGGRLTSTADAFLDEPHGGSSSNPYLKPPPRKHAGLACSIA